MSAEAFTEWQPESPFTEHEEEAEQEVREAEWPGEELIATQARIALQPRSAPQRLVAGRLYAKVVGAHQGTLAGDATARGHEGWIEGRGFGYSVKSDRDAATGHATGRRRHGPVVLATSWNAASVKLFQALVGNEVLTSVTFEFPAIDAAGVEHIAQRVTLTDAFVAGLTRADDASQGETGPTEQVSFVFGKITIEDVAGQVTAVDALGGAGSSAEAEAPDGA